MRVFLFILFSSIAISSQVPSKFTLHTTGNETRFIYHSGKEATVSLQNSLAGNLNSIDSSSIRRFQISATASSFSNVPHADHTAVYSDFSTNTFIGGNHVCSSDIKGVVIVNDVIKGYIKVVSDSTRVTVFAPDRFNIDVKLAQ